MEEIYELFKDATVDGRKGRPVNLSFSLVYPNRDGRMVIRKVGEVDGRRSSRDDKKTLHDLQFQTGDFMDVAVL